jgi:hypothetical protein
MRNPQGIGAHDADTHESYDKQEFASGEPASACSELRRGGPLYIRMKQQALDHTSCSCKVRDTGEQRYTTKDPGSRKLNQFALLALSTFAVLSKIELMGSRSTQVS